MKKWIVLLVFVAFCSLAGAQTESGPGAAPAAPAGVKYSLDEERFVAAFQKEGQAKFEKAVEEAVGKKITVEVDFPSFAGSYDSMKYIEGTWCTEAIVSALKAICTDDIGKRRVGEAVKKIVIKNDKAATAEMIKLDAGTLTIPTNLASTGVSSSALEEYLKKNI